MIFQPLTRRRYRRQELLGKLEAAGFEAVYLSHFNVLLFPLIAAVRLANRLLGSDGSDDERIPAAPVNALLAALFAGERHWIGRNNKVASAGHDGAVGEVKIHSPAQRPFRDIHVDG